MNNSQVSNSIFLRPIKIGIAYSVFTILLYLFGPYAFPAVNRELLIVFLVIVNISMYLGFAKGATKSTYVTIHRNYPDFNIYKWYKAFFIIAFLIAIPKFIIYTGFYDNTFSRLSISIVTFFAGGSDILYESRQMLGNATGVWVYINYIVILLGPIHWAYTPLAMYYWGKLSFAYKIGTIIIWLFYLLQYICTGTNVGIFEFFIMLFIIKIIKNMTGRAKKRISGKGKYNIVLIAVLIGILLFSFNYIMSARIGSNTESVPLGNTNAYFDNESIMWQYVPDFMRQVFLYLTRYMAVPYYALEQAFNIDFTTTYGFGYSWFLLDNMPMDLWPDTYMMKLENQINYSHWASWHTAYMWFANDVSFWGVPIVLFVLFYIFGRSWHIFLQTGNMCAFLLFMLFVKMMTYISANNQAFQASDHLFAFWYLLIFFKRSLRYKWNIPF